MADDKKINLMPEDLRKNDDLVKKSNWSFVPDLSAPAKKKSVKLHATSGSTPSFFAKIFSGLKPVPKVKPLAVDEAKVGVKAATVNPTPAVAVMKSPIFTAPDIKALDNKMATAKVEESIQQFVKPQVATKLKKTGPNFFVKILAALKPAPKAKRAVGVTLAKPMPQAPAVIKPAPQVVTSPEPIQPIIKTAPLISDQILQPTNKTEKIVTEHIQDFAKHQTNSVAKFKPAKPSFWSRLLSWFRRNKKAPQNKVIEPKESVLSQAIKRNGYKVASTEMHQPMASNNNSPKQDLNKMPSATSQVVEDVLEVKAKPILAPEPVSAPVPGANKIIEEPVIITPKAVEPDFSLSAAKTATVPVAPNMDNQMPEVTNPGSGQFHQPAPLGRGKLSESGGNVDLIPMAAKIRSWRQINSLLFLSGIASLVIIGVLYGSLFVQEQAMIKEQKRQQAALMDIEKQILDFNDLNKNIKDLSSEINLVQEALSKHIYWTKFFTMLETYTLPEVFYAGISAGNNGALTLSASTDSYEAVARQLKVFESESAKEFVQSATINAAALGKTGVTFSVNLVLNPDLFYYEK